MKCPYCDSEDTKVIDSRPTEDGHAIRRRRYCEVCENRFTTYEKVEATIKMIIKKDGRREVFDRSKIIAGIARACEKRPVTMEQIEKIADRIEKDVNNRNEKEVPSDYLGEKVMENLKDLDQVAYIRFASVYREFKDVNTFAEAVEMLKGNEAQEGNAKILRVAIDGPSGAGKSTVAKKVAEELGIDYIDTGAMYRAVGYKMKQNGIAVIDAEKILKMIEHTDIDFEDGKIYLDGIDVSDKIRTEEISKAASACARLQPVREKLVEIQRRIGHRKSVVMDGRDIGTNVFPDAQAKFYVDAAPEERAKRRFLELREKGEEVNFEDVLEDVRKRDENDMTRELDPLRKADDAVLIDTTDMTVDEVVREILSAVKNKKA